MIRTNRVARSRIVQGDARTVAELATSAPSVALSFSMAAALATKMAGWLTACASVGGL